MVSYRQDPLVKGWIWRLVALCLLPTWLVPRIAAELLPEANSTLSWYGIQLICPICCGLRSIL